MDELDEIWILHESGVCLYNYAIEKNMNPALFGSFFTAINQFGQECANNSIDDITMGNNFLSSYKIPEYHVILIGRSTKTKKRKTMQKILEKIAKIFKTQYSPEDIANFDGKVDKFNNLTSLIDYFFNQQEHMIEELKMIF
ncbi:MAG: hypothetical protein K9W44_01045 [Candidatus Lokiarchaeota archaeon]|nr:hypothetical protein [Candidatus Harpocratesius repetitus]